MSQFSSSISGPLKLKGRLGTEVIPSATDEIGGEYNEAMILDSTPKSLWVIYSQKHWCHANGAKEGEAAVVRPSNEQTIIMEPRIMSVQGFDMVNPGVILFEHSRFSGYGKIFESSEETLTDHFSQGQIPGVSSAIITGGIWNLFTGYNYTGTKLTFDGKQNLGPGEYDFGDLSSNDQAKSLLYVRRS